ncbi:hypothetical protein [Stackebrandtia soli]|uniref:hypothetical protein n=1 Tax=Stackebrandtia soli TaxID=1892856 RepID=UPI0039E8C578
MRKNWPRWIGYATAIWSLSYALLGLYWTFGGGGFPFGSGDPQMAREGANAIHANVLGLATPEIAGPIIAGVGLFAAVVAALMAAGKGTGGGSVLLLSSAWTMVVVLGIVIQDYRPLTLVAYLPIFAIGKIFFGWPEGVGLEALVGWPILNLASCLIAAVAFAMTAVAYRRRVRDACGDCGRSDGDDGRGLVRWGRPAVIVAITVPLIYCTTRWLWALGFSLGIDPQWYAEGQENGLWLAGAALATLGLGGAILTLGLIQRWGEVFPRWMIGLRGRRVPPMLAVIPALAVAVLVTAAGTMYIRMAFTMGVEGTWVTNMPETLWPLWGAGLAVAALAYHQRRRGPCVICGRGTPTAA